MRTIQSFGRWFLQDFHDRNTLGVTDEVVLEYSDYICSEFSFYSGLPLVSFNELQDKVQEALNEYIVTRNKSVQFNYITQVHDNCIINCVCCLFVVCYASLSAISLHVMGVKHLFHSSCVLITGHWDIFPFPLESEKMSWPSKSFTF